MNHWTKLSVEFASQRNYLDELFKVYPISPNLRMDIGNHTEAKIKRYFNKRNNIELIKILLDLVIFSLIV